MPTFKIELDQQTYEYLVAVAIRERRPTQWQAEMLLKTAVLREAGVQQNDVQVCTAARLKRERGNAAHNP